MKIFKLTMLASLLCFSVHGAETATYLQAAVTDYKNATLAFIGSSNHPLKLKSFCNCAYINQVTLMNQARRGRNFFVMISLGGPSKEIRDNHYCGAGTEGNIVWLKLDEKRAVVDSASYLVDSCFKTVESSQPLGYRDKQRILNAEFTSFSEMKKYWIYYNPAKPYKGFRVVSKVLENQ
jgi:hypothetical protein